MFVGSQLITAATSFPLRAAAYAHEVLNFTEPPLNPYSALEGLGLGLDQLPLFDLEQLTPEQRKAFINVRGLLHPEQRKVYLSPLLSPSREPFVISHEIGHAIIPSHLENLYLDTEYTLSLKVKARMEREANEFAGHLLFFGDRFSDEAADLPFGMTSVIALKERYNTSFESTAFRYVRTATRPCCLQVFSIEPNVEGQLDLRFKYQVAKGKGQWKHPCKINQVLSLDHPYVTFTNSSQLMSGSVETLTIPDFQLKRVVVVNLFCNSHAIMALKWVG